MVGIYFLWLDQCHNEYRVRKWLFCYYHQLFNSITLFGLNFLVKMKYFECRVLLFLLALFNLESFPRTSVRVFTLRQRALWGSDVQAFEQVGRNSEPFHVYKIAELSPRISAYCINATIEWKQLKEYFAEYMLELRKNKVIYNGALPHFSLIFLITHNCRLQTSCTATYSNENCS